MYYYDKMSKCFFKLIKKCIIKVVMKMEYINGSDLYQMFNYGTVYIMQERKHLNDINVFPVADGDTGNNLAHTLKTIIRESNPDNSFFKTLDSLSESALIGARGNSGVIFAQFVNGLRLAATEEEKVDIMEFGRLIEESYNHTYSSLSNPVEGTMVTMMGELSSFISEGHTTTTPLKDVFDKVYQKSLILLKKTTKMLDVLTKNNVVDSGALGFVLFLKGIRSYFNNENIELIDTEEVYLEDSHSYEGNITYRYCTEGLVKYNEFTEVDLRNRLDRMGDSVIIAQGKSRLRIHIHTDKPQDIFKLLKGYGEIEYQKVDDMKLEIKMNNSKRNRIIVTDSIADIDKDFLLNNNVVVIPTNVIIEGVSYIDKLTISNEILFENVENYLEYPTTATPSIKYINDLFSRLLLKFDEIIVITVSSKLSGTHDIIKSQANKINNNGKKITVIDSLSNSSTEGLIVSKVIEMIRNNCTTENIVKEVEIMREKATILVCLDTFKYAVKGGRVPKIIGTVGMMLGLRPIMTLKQGKGSAFGFAFSQKGITKKIKKLVEDDIEKTGIDNYSLVHCLNEKLVDEYTKLFTTIIGKKPEFITEISSATAIHSGVGSVAIGYIKK